MQTELTQKLEEAVWIAHSLFERGKVSGSTANMSFRTGNRVYITASGCSFGRLTAEDFAVMDVRTHQVVSGDRKPSKEWPLHLAIYERKEEVNAVLHTHSFYSSLWSCLRHEDRMDCIPEYTPYLRMKVGKVGLISYGRPGSEKLFTAFREEMGDRDAWLLANHGPVVPGHSLMDAFYGLEELEESARLAWELRKEPSAVKISE